MRTADIIDLAAARARAIEQQVAAEIAAAEAELAAADLRYHARRALIFNTIRGTFTQAMRDWDEVSDLLRLAAAQTSGATH